MPRHLIVVSRREQQLYSYLLDRFEGDTNIVVILDRRSGEDRRVGGRARPFEGPERRRGGDRRRRRSVEDELQARGHVVVSLECHETCASL